jgi:hypothetical protein
MWIFANIDLQVLTEIAATTQPIQLLSTPRDSEVPVVVSFVKNGEVYDPEPYKLSVGNSSVRLALTSPDVELNDLVWQEDTGRRYRLIDASNIDDEDSWEVLPKLDLEWLVKKENEFDSLPAAILNDFTRSGAGANTIYTGYANYITSTINTALGINPPTVSDDVVQFDAMAQLSWSGLFRGKTNWIKHAIRNDLSRDGDPTPAYVGTQSGQATIASGVDSVEITFSPPYSSSGWHFICPPVVSNSVDSNPPGIFVIGITNKTANGFTAHLSADTPTANYSLEWVAILN